MLNICILGGQGDIGEIKIQITTAAPDKSVENEAEALQDNNAQKSGANLTVSHTPEGKLASIVRFFSLVLTVRLKSSTKAQRAMYYLRIFVQ